MSRRGNPLPLGLFGRAVRARREMGRHVLPREAHTG